MKRRDFMRTTALAAGLAAWLPRRAGAAVPGTPSGPNVLWISTEDISPDLGCYGDTYAVTSNLDRLAGQGTRYDACFAHMGVCAPARSGIITGMYPTSIGTNHMRCRGVPPPAVKCFTEYLRAAGYYCTNRSKTDYQFASPVTAWDRGRNDWQGRGKDQPFFSVINITSTHESQIRNMGRRRQLPQQLGKDKHDPAKATLPPYYPDTPTVREDWAQYYDIITVMDRDIADILARLEADGLADDTIVWFWGDHGRGMPRGKRWIYDSGLRVPLLIRVPEKWRQWAAPKQPPALAPGTVSRELVSFVDFAPTMLSLAGVPVPAHIQGQAFLGPQKAAPRHYIFGARDRVDEAYDMIRCVRDERYKYIRNFMPHLPRSLDIEYMNQMPTMREMRRLFAAGELTGPQLQYFEQPKPIEELYDTTADPDEVVNLAGRPEHQGILERLRQEMFRWMRQVQDFGVLPECEFDAWKRPADQLARTAAPGIAPHGNGDAVTVTCATPGASLAYRVSGATAPGVTGDGIVLAAAKARFEGKKPWPKKEATNLSAWRNSEAWVSWDLEMTESGKLPVHVLWGCGGKERSLYTVEVAGQRLEGRAENTGGWDTVKAATLGTVEIPKPGKYVVTLKPVPKAGLFQMDLQAVVLGSKPAQPLAPIDGGSDWQLYTGPVALKPGRQIEVQACRLGFKDSPVVRYRHGAPGVPGEAPKAAPHWSQTLAKNGIVDRVLKLKERDGAGAPALAGYEKALDDPAGAVRYWAALGIYRGHDRNPVKDRTKTEAAAYLPRFRQLLHDDTSAVRIVAAQALVDWGETDSGLSVLVHELESHPLASGRLQAITALHQLGDKARGALPAIHKAAKAGGYVTRMAQHAIRKLG